MHTPGEKMYAIALFINGKVYDLCKFLSEINGKINIHDTQYYKIIIINKIQNDVLNWKSY